MSRLNRLLLFLVLGFFVALAGLWILGGKKSEYSTYVLIDAQPKQVFPYLTQPEQLKQWISGLKSVDEILPQPEAYSPRPDMQRVIVDKSGRESRYSDIVIRFTPDEMVSVQSSNASEVATSIFNLKEQKTGRKTKTMLTYQIKSTNVGLGRFLGPLSTSERQDQIVDDARKLKQLVESELRSSSEGKLSDDNSKDPKTSVTK